MMLEDQDEPAERANGSRNAGRARDHLMVVMNALRSGHFCMPPAWPPMKAFLHVPSPQP